MELEISCAMCGKEKKIAIPTDEPIPSIEDVIVRAKWIVEHNGPNFDIYCSKRCAE